MRFRNEIVEQANGRFRYLGLIEELDDQREIDVEPQKVIGVDLAARAEPGDAAENRDSLHGVPDHAEGLGFLASASCAFHGPLR